MTYIDIIINKKESLDSIYDMVAMCYDLIIEEICDEELFIGEYIVKNEQANENNPNIEILICFQEKICNQLDSFSGDIDNCFVSIIGLLKEVDNKIVPFGTEKINRLTPLYFLILAIDRYSEKINNCQFSNTPLNHEYAEKSFIYFKPCKSLIYEASKELKFSRYITDNSISNCLNNLTIVKSDIYSNNRTPTKIYNLYLEKRELPTCILEKKLNVAIIPFNGFKITNISKDKGALFTIKYSSNYVRKYSERAIILLKKAIQEKANIIVFPEYICSEEIQENIRICLKEIKDTDPDKVKDLLFVVAGTGWINGNNISKIYDKDGYLLGSHYKITKFGNDRLIENLQSPGKESLAIDVQGVGRFMPAICRDISYGNDMVPLFNAFRPFEILIPAWSSSINIGFITQCKNLAEKYQMSCILCNSCEPLKNEPFKKEINLIVTPFKDMENELTYITGKVNEVQRTENCYCNCNNKACIFMITMDYSVENVRNGNIVRGCEQMITEID